MIGWSNINEIWKEGQLPKETLNKFIAIRPSQRAAGFTRLLTSAFDYSWDWTGAKHRAATKDEILQVKQVCWPYGSWMQIGSSTITTAMPRTTLCTFARIVLFFRKKGGYVFGFLKWYQIWSLQDLWKQWWFQNLWKQWWFQNNDGFKFLKRSTLQNSALRFLLMCFLKDNFSPTPSIRYDTGSSVSQKSRGKTQNETTHLLASHNSHRKPQS